MRYLLRQSLWFITTSHKATGKSDQNCSFVRDCDGFISLYKATGGAAKTVALYKEIKLGFWYVGVR